MSKNYVEPEMIWRKYVCPLCKRQEWFKDVDCESGGNERWCRCGVDGSSQCPMRSMPKTRAVVRTSRRKVV